MDITRGFKEKAKKRPTTPRSNQNASSEWTKEKDKNDRLERQQVDLMKEKMALEIKTEHFRDIYDKMVHSGPCLDDACTFLISTFTANSPKFENPPNVLGSDRECGQSKMKRTKIENVDDLSTYPNTNTVICRILSCMNRSLMEGNQHPAALDVKPQSSGTQKPHTVTEERPPKSSKPAGIGKRKVSNKESCYKIRLSPNQPSLEDVSSRAALETDLEKVEAAMTELKIDCPSRCE